METRPIARTGLFKDPAALAELCQRHHIGRLSVFGSAAAGKAGAKSDIDVLVEFEPGAAPSLFDMVGIEEELSRMLGGTHVDLRTAEDLSRHFRDEVVRGAVVQYESR